MRNLLKEIKALENLHKSAQLDKPLWDNKSFQKLIKLLRPTSYSECAKLYKTFKNKNNKVWLNSRVYLTKTYKGYVIEGYQNELVIFKANGDMRFTTNSSGERKARQFAPNPLGFWGSKNRTAYFYAMTFHHYEGLAFNTKRPLKTIKQYIKDYNKEYN